jgi:hypothetical protein
VNSSPTLESPQGHHRPSRWRCTYCRDPRSPSRGSPSHRQDPSLGPASSPGPGLAPQQAWQRHSRPLASDSSTFQARFRGSQSAIGRHRAPRRPCRALSELSCAPSEAFPWFGTSHPAPYIAAWSSWCPSTPSSLGPRASPRPPASGSSPSQLRPGGQGYTGGLQHPSRVAHPAPS